MKYLLSSDKNFYKANLHAHTLSSGGKFTAEELKSLYARLGYSIVAFNEGENFITHDGLNEEGFLALNGAEITFKDRFRNEAPTSVEYQMRKTSDLGLIAPAGVTELPKLPYPLSSKIFLPEHINAVRRIYKDAGFFTIHYNPVYNLEGYDDYMAYDAPDALEIVNFSSFLDGAFDRNENIFEDMLLAGKRVFAVASDGNRHMLHYTKFLGAWTMINAEELTYEAVMDALFGGSFYASEGPEINAVYVGDDNRLYIETSDAASIRIMTNTRTKSLKINEDGTPVNKASIGLSRSYEYIRFVVTDRMGRQAFTNAYFMDDIME